MQYQKQLRLTT